MAKKRYYWLKLNENFFERDEIKILEGMKNGKDYIIFYMKLLLKSISSDGILIFNGCIPFTPEMLASITNTSIDTARVATNTLIQLGLMEQWDDGKLFMVMTQNMIGSEGDSAARVRALRESKKETKLLQCNAIVTECNTDIEIDKEKDIDIKIDIDKYITAWNSLGLNKLVSIKNKRYSSLKARIKDYGEDKVLQAISKINNSKFLKGENDKKWTITFDWFLKPNNFIKVLEGNYDDKQEKSSFNNFKSRNIYNDENKMKDLENKLLGWDKDE